MQGLKLRWYDYGWFAFIWLGECFGRSIDRAVWAFEQKRDRKS